MTPEQEERARNRWRNVNEVDIDTIDAMWGTIDALREQYESSVRTIAEIMEQYRTLHTENHELRARVKQLEGGQ